MAPGVVTKLPGQKKQVPCFLGTDKISHQQGTHLHSGRQVQAQNKKFPKVLGFTLVGKTSLSENTHMDLHRIRPETACFTRPSSHPPPTHACTQVLKICRNGWFPVGFPRKSQPTGGPNPPALLQAAEVDLEELGGVPVRPVKDFLRRLGDEMRQDQNRYTASN